MTCTFRTMLSGLAALAAAAVVSAAAAAQEPPVNPQARALKEFGDRIQAYQALRNTLAGGVAPMPRDASPTQIRQHQRELAAAIRKARHGSKQGDVFTPPVVPQFRTIIRRDLRARDVRDALAALQEVPSLFVQVNGEWPDDAPRATVPPQLLANLYPLPRDLEYRFVGRHLVLLDSEASLIVDYIRGVVPSVAARK